MPRLVSCNSRAYEMNRLWALRILCWRASGLCGSQGYANSDRSRPVLRAAQIARVQRHVRIRNASHGPTAAPSSTTLQGKPRASQMRQTNSFCHQRIRSVLVRVRSNGMSTFPNCHRPSSRQPSRPHQSNSRCGNRWLRPAGGASLTSTNPVSPKFDVGLLERKTSRSSLGQDKLSSREPRALSIIRAFPSNALGC
jgi:hypothetical protein